ncbi:hypothetical protein PVL30_005288 [Lodderomyces elongisporus]|uniref:uncharacterized protein n=1 Tax=Lodderomyces elongisporus TaxID=36914 RepID=UPI002923F050|nr:uncharacterized protein PVL30_005288 [Lodderomyces elongisporus]WLF81491.1 hypothetical protein PVL30_005288 [Lodderomyces elongisporus]
MLQTIMNLTLFISQLEDDKYLNESLLSEPEFIITSLPPLYLASKIANGTYTSSEVTAAFVKKYLIAHYSSGINPQVYQEIHEALAMAKFLDAYYKNTGKSTIGPLHGLPVSKDQLSAISSPFEGVADDALGYVKLNFTHYDLSGSLQGPVSPRMNPSIVKGANAVLA